MIAMYVGPFTSSGGLAWPLLPLAGARLVDAYGLARGRPGGLPRSVMVSGRTPRAHTPWEGRRGGGGGNALCAVVSGVRPRTGVARG